MLYSALARARNDAKAKCSGSSSATVSSVGGRSRRTCRRRRRCYRFGWLFCMLLVSEILALVHIPMTINFSSYTIYTLNLGDISESDKVCMNEDDCSDFSAKEKSDLLFYYWTSVRFLPPGGFGNLEHPHEE